MTMMRIIIFLTAILLANILWGSDNFDPLYDKLTQWSINNCHLDINELDESEKHLYEKNKMDHHKWWSEKREYLKQSIIKDLEDDETFINILEKSYTKNRTALERSIFRELREFCTNISLWTEKKEEVYFEILLKDGECGKFCVNGHSQIN